ncbi:MAG: 4Fe-4S binding protein [Acidobacteria bacterium]|nr:4Fe-4S binding protein [Acidobacteriota bacterium]
MDHAAMGHGGTDAEYSHSEQSESAPHAHPEEAAAPHAHHDTAAEGEAGHVHSGGAAGEQQHAEHPHEGGTPSPGLVKWLFIATFVIAAGLIVYMRRCLSKAVPPVSPKTNLLDAPVIGKILRSRYFNWVLIAPTLVIFTFIVVTGFLGEQNTSNPAVLLTWILWWPAVIFTFFILGRIWCAICPFAYLGDVAQKIFSLKRKVPVVFRNMWWRLGLFLALTWATTLWALDRWPTGTAWLALAETLGAILLAFIFEKRAFCRFLCPVGGVFGLYSMTAPVRLSAKDQMVCYNSCPQKNCYASCAWFLYPATVDRNTECSLCLDCVRACPHDNLKLETQPFGGDLMRDPPKRKSLDEALAIAMVMGVALLQTAVMLNWWQDWQTRIGNFLHLEPGRLLYTLLYIALGMIAPVLLVLLIVWFTRPSRGGFSQALRTYAYSFVPLALALHAAHNFHHLFGEGSAMWSGLKAYIAKYAGWAVDVSQEVATGPSPNTLFLMQWVALLGGLYLAWRVGIALVKRTVLAPQNAFRTALPIVLFATAFTVLNLVALSSAMSHRH